MPRVHRSFRRCGEGAILKRVMRTAIRRVPARMTHSYYHESECSTASALRLSARQTVCFDYLSN